MRWVKFLYLALGFALLVAVVGETNLDEVYQRVSEIGWGLVAILAIYCAAFAIDSFTWLMALPSQPMNILWLVRAFLVRIVGEAFNHVIPAASMGGEPVKAVLLKRRYDVGYREAVASLILARTINMVALCLFLFAGFSFIIADEQLSGSSKGIAGIGLTAMLLLTCLFFAVQRFRITSLTGIWLSRWRIAARLEAVVTKKRIEPDQPATGFVKAAHLKPQISIIIPVQPVGDQQHHRPLTKDAARPFTVEALQRIGNTRTARPVLYAN